MLNELIRYTEGLNLDLYVDGVAVTAALKQAYVVVADSDALL